jgi:hypothetical protein
LMYPSPGRSPSCVEDRVNALKARVHPLPQGEKVSELAARVEKTWSND